MLYVPSPIPLVYDRKYQALANPRGRMQYYEQLKGENRLRIGRADFIRAYNKSNIIAIRPVQITDPSPVLQFEFFTIEGSNQPET